MKKFAIILAVSIFAFALPASAALDNSVKRPQKENTLSALFFGRSDERTLKFERAKEMIILDYADRVVASLSRIDSRLEILLDTLAEKIEMLEARKETSLEMAREKLIFAEKSIDASQETLATIDTKIEEAIIDSVSPREAFSNVREVLGGAREEVGEAQKAVVSVITELKSAVSQIE